MQVTFDGDTLVKAKFSASSHHLKNSLCSMPSEAFHVVNSRHTDLTVSGFTRRNYRDSIPIEIVNLIKCFYSLWIKGRLSSEAIQKLPTLKQQQTFEIANLNLTVQGAKLKVTFVGQQNPLAWNCDTFHVGLRVRFPADIQYISGIFAVGYNGGLFLGKWVRSCKSFTLISELQRNIRISELKKSSDFVVMGYVNIMQIKWMSPTGNLNFDITPPFKRSGRHHLSLNKQDICELRGNRVISKTRDGEWSYRIERFHFGHRHFGEGFRLRGNPLFLPVDAVWMDFEWTVRHKITGKRYRKVVQSLTGELVANANLKVDDLTIETNIEIEIEYQIKELYREGREQTRIPIEKCDWKKYNVI